MNNYTTPDLFQLLFVSHLPTCQYIIRKYNIERVENRAFAEFFCFVYQRVQMNIIFVRQCTYIVFIRQCQEAQNKLNCLNSCYIIIALI